MTERKTGLIDVHIHLQGEPGYLDRLIETGEYFRRRLWWEGAWRRIVFGTDVRYPRLSWAVEVYRDILDGCEVSAEDREAVWTGNMRRMLGL